ncbi:hypothetical protein N7485_007960 [Penicillium canescens]|nr:hypothetical protein N7485_007960 [Penicillium canescens]
MHHSHFRHSRIERLMSARHHLQAELTDDAIDIGLLEDHSPSATPNLPATDVITDETCDPSKNATCLERELNGSDRSPQKRDETTPTATTVVETVLQVVDTSSHTLWQSTGAAFPMTFSDPSVGTFTIPPSDSATATATASVSISAELSMPTLPPLVSATQSATSLLSEPSLSSITNSTQSTTSRAPSSSRIVSAISSPATSTPLVAPSTVSSSSFNSPYGYYWSQSETDWASSTSKSSTATYTSSSTSSYGSSEETSTETGSGSTPTASETTAVGTGSSSDAATPKIVGGVVGSIAGLALLLFLLVYFLRRRGLLRGKMGAHAPLSDDAAIGTVAGAGTREIAERRSSNDPLFTASYFAPAFMKRWRQSTQTVRTESTIDSNSSERGFQKISGRKLPPVLTHGGDGFGGGLDGDSPTVPGFPPTSPGPGPTGSPAFHAPPPASPYGMPLDSKYTREIEEHQPPVPPSPVHLPISNTVPVATPITVTPAHPVAQPQSAIPIVPQRPDGLGRSLPSFDGSRSSRFTEGIDM